jgi:nicotinamidase-related amidase
MNLIHGQRSALLVLDMQGAVLERNRTQPEMVSRMKWALETARAWELQVVFAKVAFREGHPEIDPHNYRFSELASAGMLIEGDSATDIVAELAPDPTEPVVTKRRVSAFVGSDLEVILRARGITTLVLTGVSTSGVVLFTFADAVDRDFEVVVLCDGCSDSDSQAHRLAMEYIFPRHGNVMTIAEWVSWTIQH